MRVSISGIQNEADLKLAVDAGTDAVGFLVGQVHQSTRFILPSTAGRLANQLPPYISPVLVTHLNQVDEIAEIIDKSNINCVQLHGRTDFDEIKKLRDRFSEHLQIILATYIVDQANFDDLDDIYPFIDAVVMDCYNCEPALIGLESNNRYMWAVGADFVRRSPVPVILAGGLSDENIAEAIAKVKPYAVDACSKLRRSDDDQLVAARCQRYIYNAKMAGFAVSSAIKMT